MFRMWCKLFDDRGHLIKDTVIKNADSDLNRTRKIFAAIHDACYEANLARFQCFRIPAPLESTLH